MRAILRRSQRRVVDAGLECDHATEVISSTVLLEDAPWVDVLAPAAPAATILARLVERVRNWWNAPRSSSAAWGGAMWTVSYPWVVHTVVS